MSSEPKARSFHARWGKGVHTTNTEQTYSFVQYSIADNSPIKCRSRFIQSSLYPTLNKTLIEYLQWRIGHAQDGNEHESILRPTKHRTFWTPVKGPEILSETIACCF